MADELTAGGVPVYRDSAGGLREQKGQAQVDALAATVSGKADASAIPQPASTTPRSEMTGGSKGTEAARYALEDHQHPRLTSTTYATLANDGTATVTFTRSFANKPGVVMTETDANGMQPLVVVVQSWVRDANGAYVGAVVKGYRSTLLPVLAPMSATAVLSGVIAGVNAINSALSNLNVFGGSAAGAIVSVIAVARSDVSAS